MMETELPTIMLVSEWAAIHHSVKKRLSTVRCDLIAVSSYAVASKLLDLNVADLLIVDCRHAILSRQEGTANELGQNLILKAVNQESKARIMVIRAGETELSMLSNVDIALVYVPLSPDEIVAIAKKRLGIHLSDYEMRPGTGLV